MLTGVDRIQVVVRDRAAAVETYAALFDARVVREDQLTQPEADRTVVQMGLCDVEFLQPRGQGAVQRFLDRRGEGLFAAGFATGDLARLATRLSARGIEYVRERGQIHIGPEQLAGLRMVITQPGDRDPVGDRIACLYEVTFIAEDHAETAETLADVFDLDAAKFHPIESEPYGYTGTLTLFDPPEQLDRVEVVQIVNPDTPMGRFAAKRGGPCLYMCFWESPNVQAILDACDARGARWAPLEWGRDEPRPSGCFIHPAGTHGVLIGISRPNLAWLWSGDPDRARAASPR